MSVLLRCRYQFGDGLKGASGGHYVNGRVASVATGAKSLSGAKASFL